jgi:hypothetical protein
MAGNAERGGGRVHDGRDHGRGHGRHTGRSAVYEDGRAVGTRPAVFRGGDLWKRRMGVRRLRIS